VSWSSSCDTGALFNGVRGYNPSDLETAEASSRSGSRMDEHAGYHAEAFFSSARTLRGNGTNPQSPLRTCRFATVKAATPVARLRTDLAAAAGPSLGSAKDPALTPVWRRQVRCQRHVPALPVRPNDARARARISSSISRFDRFRPFSRVQSPNRYAVTQARNHRRQRLPIQPVGSAIVR
jgi:hypothetical protein